MNSIVRITQKLSKQYGKLSSLQQFSLNKTSNKYNVFGVVRQYSTPITGEKDLANVLSNEIKTEKEMMKNNPVPNNFIVKERIGSEIILERKDNDGMNVEVSVDLAGSITPTSEEEGSLESLPDFTITLTKSSGKYVRFNCTLNVDQQDLQGDTQTPTYSVESVEVDSVPNYYTVSEVMDEKVFENLTELLLERKLDLEFQEQLKEFCTSEEHKLYCKFLEGLQQFCK